MTQLEGTIQRFIGAQTENDIIETALAGIVDNTAATAATFAIIQDSTLVLRASTDETVVTDSTPIEIPPDRIEELRERSDARLLPSCEVWEPVIANLNHRHTNDAQTFLLIPVHEEALLLAAASTTGAFGQQDRATASQIADYTAIALDRYHQLSDHADRLEEFASILSHDLRNPLLVAEGYLQLARESPSEEHYTRVEQALERIDELIDQISTLARTGRRIDDPSPVDFEQAVHQAWTHIVTHDARLEFKGPSATILADGMGLTQLLENLFANAVEHGGSTVIVRVGLTDAGFYVEDDGPGIPADQRDQVFERGYSSADDQPGLGLSIVEQLATAHDWEVHVTESDAGGARFEITGVDRVTPNGAEKG